jgi:hypothetical protein
MQVRADQLTESGSSCGCGRSPTGKCIGWHALSEEEFREKLAIWEHADYIRRAKETWNDSCTSERSK